MEKPKIVTRPTGPKSVPWMERSQTSTQYRTFRFETIFSEAQGAYLYDVDGNSYMSFSTSAHHLGYRHPAIIAAAKEQLDLTGVGRIRGIHPTIVTFSEKLLEIAPPSISKGGKVAFANTGSDAGEFALLLSRAYTGKQMVFTHFGAHHGFGALALSLTADRSEHRRTCPPILPGVVHIPYPNCYRCIFGQKYPNCDFLCIEYIRHAQAMAAHPDETAAFFVEPVRSQGVIVPPNEYFPTLKELCEENEILFVDDEAMVGFGRCGTMWGLDHWGVEPDISYQAKSIANGMTMATVMGTKEIMEQETQFSVVRGGTYAGNLVACAIASAHLTVLEEEKLVERSAEVGAYLMKRLTEVAEKQPLIGDVRGRGLFIGIELVKDQKTKKPGTEEAKRFVTEAFHRGILIGTVGIYSQVLRLMPPLILTKEEVDTAVTIIEEALKAVELHFK